LKTLIVVLLFAVNVSFAQQVIHLKSVNDIENIITENEGKVIVFNFWASWCKPCVEEFPDLIKLNNNYRNKDFKLIFISLDFKEETDSKLYPFLKSNNVDFSTYLLDVSNPDDIMNYFDKNWNGGIPSTFIFDKSGKMKKFILGGHDYDYFEKEIMKLI
jgi:thiol-disulfide isomerase/thioredoxin